MLSKLFRSSLLFLLPAALIAGDILPADSEQVNAYVQRAEQKMLEKINQIASVPDEQRTYENTQKAWNQLGAELLADFSVLIALAEADLSVKAAAQEGAVKLQGLLQKALMQNVSIFPSLVQYAGQALLKEGITPYESYQLQSLLASAGIAVEPAIKKAPFVYLQGEATTPKGHGELTVFTLNTCFLPGNLGLIHGGVAPWETRVQPLAEKIQSVNADVVCLQEVHTEDASYALYEALKNDYAHFYIAIGQRPLAFDMKNIGLGSGLFVASKYPIENPQFTLFPELGYPMNFGYFDFVVKSGEVSIAHLYTTHMHPHDAPEFIEIRAMQLQQILDKMQKDAVAAEGIPYVLCGDLNIPNGEQEPAEVLIRDHFYDDYCAELTEVTEANRTCTDYFTNLLFAPKEAADPNFQILDYALLLNRPTNLFTVDTTLIPMNDLAQDEPLITDHHGLLALVRLCGCECECRNE